MKFRALSVSNSLSIATMVFALTACGGGGDGGGVSPAAGDGDTYTTVGDLDGRTSFSFSTNGASFNEEFVYGVLFNLEGTDFRAGTSSVSSSALSGIARFDSLACATWDDLAASNAAGNTEVANLFAGSYMCSYIYTSGASSWFELYIANDNAVTGNFAFIPANSNENAYVKLVQNPTASISGTHFPGTLRTGTSAFDYLPVMDDSIQESLFASMEPTSLESLSVDSGGSEPLSGEVKMLNELRSYIEAN